ncbi:thioredoxin M4, chloroplastic isoform X2 [Raphanus sativus]|uniref:Thioredoxin M4, chloroplastic isoform X2 n=1 Tax=Raphanus sativus TaxID=3726 RepID=A0A9W3DQN1_RAPSA|nr:thioredoxin M4, chloroplastic isoform X2 [Raphanus sativus]
MASLLDSITKILVLSLLITSSILSASTVTVGSHVRFTDLSDSEWQTQVLEPDVPVLVEFWEPRCGPCATIHPIVDQLAKDFAGKFKFYKINTDESPNTTNRYGISSVPTVIVFKDGEKKDSITGAVSRETLEKTIERFLVE